MANSAFAMMARGPCSQVMTSSELLSLASAPLQQNLQNRRMYGLRDVAALNSNVLRASIIHGALPV